MLTTIPAPSKRSPFRGLMQIVRFNWPKYAAAVTFFAILSAVLLAVPLPAGGQLALAAAVACLLFWSAASLIASYWIYDLSPLADWGWLVDRVPEHAHGVSHWVNIHCGFDDTSSRLRTLFPCTSGTTIDLFDPGLMAERSIHRARKSQSPAPQTASGRPNSLPLADSTTDLVFLLLAAHEIRNAGLRAQFFREVRRVVRAGGTVVLVEHLRDAWNAMTFGPGAWHFYPRREWLRLAKQAGFTLREEGRITPFVRYFILEA